MTTIDTLFDASSPFLIAEVAQAHEGSLNIAHSFIDAVAATGAHAIKFQTHIAAEESSPEENWRVKFSYSDDSRTDYWRRMEFTEAQWAGLKEHADAVGLIFLSSPFSIAAVRMLERLEVPAWKIASGEVTNYLLLEHMLKTDRPIILSSGMSSWAELDETVARVKRAGNPYALMQCTTAYPCPPEQVGLNLITEMKERYDCPVGLSDHSASIVPSIAAATLGASCFEVHVTFSQEMFGPDVIASLTLEQLSQLADSLEMVHQMQQSPVSKDEFAREAEPLRTGFGQSLVASRDLKAGESLSFDMLTCRKPQVGLPAAQFEQWLGKTLSRDIPEGSWLKEEDFETP